MALRWESSVACWKGFLCLLVLREETPLEHLRSWLLAIRRGYPAGKRSIASCRRPEEGILSILWAFVWLWIAKDRPAEAKWLSRPEAEEVEQVLHQEQQGVSQVKNYWVAFRLPRVILLAAQYFFWSIGVYGFVLWLPSIIKAGSHLTIGITGLLSALPYLLAIILMVVASYYSDRTVERKLFVWPFLLAGAIAFYLSHFIGASHFLPPALFLLFIGGVFYAPFGPVF